MKKNIHFGGDTGTDADYKYEHDQINETSIEEEILEAIINIREDNVEESE